MRTIAPAEVTPELTALFDIAKPTMPRAFNVLEGTIAGQIVVDDPSRPVWAAVREAPFGTLYLGGQFTAPVFAALLAFVHQFGAFGIGCWPDDPLAAMLPPNSDYSGTALYFPRRAVDVAHEPFFQAAPAGYTLAPRDAALLAQSPERDDLLATFGTAENILRLTLGVAALHENVIVCEASTGAPARGWIEVGVSTAEAHRRRGLAASACARLIGLCEARGYTAWWDCAAQNLASIRLAHKLGYREARQYRYTWWAA